MTKFEDKLAASVAAVTALADEIAAPADLVTPLIQEAYRAARLTMLAVETIETRHAHDGGYTEEDLAAIKSGIWHVQELLDEATDAAGKRT